MASHGGRFEVSLDGKMLFSKKQQGRFPENAEILGMLKSRP